MKKALYKELAPKAPPQMVAINPEEEGLDEITRLQVRGLGALKVKAFIEQVTGDGCGEGLGGGITGEGHMEEERLDEIT